MAPTRPVQRLSRDTCASPTPDELRTTYATVGTIGKMAEHFSTSPKVARRWLASAGIPIRPRAVPRPSRDELYTLYIGRRLSQSRIALQFGVSDSLVVNWLADAGIETRRPGALSPVDDKAVQSLWLAGRSKREIADALGFRKVDPIAKALR